MKTYLNTVAFGALLFIIAGMYLFADSSDINSISILALSGLKFAIVSLVFMELKSGHVAYSLILLILYGLFAGSFLIFI